MKLQIIRNFNCLTKLHIIRNLNNLPALQLLPVYPGAQLHEYPLTWSTHSPPWAHGASAHSSISINNLIDVISNAIFLNTVYCCFNIIILFKCNQKRRTHVTLLKFTNVGHQSNFNGFSLIVSSQQLLPRCVGEIVNIN